MKCKYCQSERFYAHQLCRLDVIVDGTGEFLENTHKDAAKSIYDSEKPYGPFQCCGCGAEFDGDSFETAKLIHGPLQDWKKADIKKPMNLHLMTIAQFAEYIASQLDYNKIWKSQFPKCDFAIADVTECRQYSLDELVDIGTNLDSAWYGIRAANFGMDSSTLFAVADMFGGGCDQVCRLYDGIGVIEAEILLQEAIQKAMRAGDESFTDKTFLIVEIHETEETGNG